MNNVVTLHNPPPRRECPACGEVSAALRYDIEKFPYLHGKDQVILEAQVPVWKCDACESEFTDDRAEEIRHDTVCRYLGRLTPAELRAIRERYHLSQQDWAARTGFGAASIKRWETGNLIQEKAADNYLRLLRLPDIFARVGSLESPEIGLREFQFQTALSTKTYQHAAAFQLRREIA
jgi:putative zinc finger/helix-turn-helix YgiT family protein